ncbi:MAG: glycosyltransferase [Solirubrobacterales bacterium]
MSDAPIRVLRVIARLNLGGPAQQAALLSGRRFEARGYETLLVHGALAPGEDSMQDLALREGASPVFLPRFGQPVRPWSDGLALAELARMVRGFRPDVVHTHTAKAGFIGRAAALAGRPRPVIVHTYHGHVLRGYFGPVRSRAYRSLERAAARVSDRLIGVSRATVDDLVRLRVAAADRFRVIRLGLALDDFTRLPAEPDPAIRNELGVAADGEVLLTFVGRIVPIKRLDLLLEALAIVLDRGGAVRLAVVGDGELRPELEGLARRLGVTQSVSFLGYRRDLARIAAATDVAVLSSDNEGTPVSLIEAAAAARPAVATAVGGVPEVVTPQTGELVPGGDAVALAAGIERMVADAETRMRAGLHAREHAVRSFGAERLVEDIDALYRELLERREGERPVRVSRGSRRGRRRSWPAPR